MMRRLLQLLVLLVVVGCGTAPPPPPPTDPTKMVRTVVFPIIDLRATDKQPLETPACRASLDRETYASILATRNSLIYWPTADEAQHALTVGDLIDGRAENLKKARRGEADYALFTVIRRFDVDGASLEYESQAFLVEPKSGVVIWRGEHKGSKWLGVLGAVFAPFDASYRATICNAYGAMVGGAYRTIPALQRP